MIQGMRVEAVQPKKSLSYNPIEGIVRAKGAVIMFSYKWTAALAVAAVFALQPTASNAQSRIGSANSVKPEASGSVAGTLSAGSGIHANETVKTGSSGQAGLGFVDKTNLQVGPSSTVRLDKFVYDPNKGTKSIVIDATKGAFRFSTGAQGKGDVQVKTPHGTLGIRG
jgi:hypothetical protein